MAGSNELYNEIMEQVAEFKEASDKWFGGNKSAGARARKLTMKIQDLFKTYRAATVAETKDMAKK